MQESLCKKPKTQKVLIDTQYPLNKLKERYQRFYEDYLATIKDIQETGLSFRLRSIPEDISENLVRLILLRLNPNRNIKWGKSIDSYGDLYSCNDSKRLEVKTFTSDGPISFGPKECWDEIYFLDARKLIEGHFVLYCLTESNKSSIWTQINVNRTETFDDHAKNKRRPRCTWKLLQQQLDNKLVKIYEGDLSHIFSDNSNRAPIVKKKPLIIKL